MLFPPLGPADQPDPETGKSASEHSGKAARPPTVRLALFPLSSVLAPNMPIELHVFEPRYRQMVADLLRGGSDSTPEFGVVALRRGWEVGEVGDLHEVGTAALISDVVPLPDGRCNLTAVGRRRFAIRWVDPTSQPYLQAHVTFLPDRDGALAPGAAARLRQLAQRHADLLEALGVEPDESFQLPIDASALAYAIIAQPGLSLADRQAILAAEDTASRLSTAADILRREVTLVRRLRAVPISASDFTSSRTPG